jgi:hypothetical protein
MVAENRSVPGASVAFAGVNEAGCYAERKFRSIEEQMEFYKDNGYKDTGHKERPPAPAAHIAPTVLASHGPHAPAASPTIHLPPGEDETYDLPLPSGPLDTGTHSRFPSSW